MKPLAKRVARLAAVGYALYLCLIDHTPHGTECREAISPNGQYRAERCLLEWIPGSESKYAGRIFSTQSGKMLVQRIFSTSVPTILWFKDGNMTFSTGGDDAFIVLPLSTWDRLMAARPRLEIDLPKGD
jgi:hypothetical protein